MMSGLLPRHLLWFRGSAVERMISAHRQRNPGTPSLLHVPAPVLALRTGADTFPISLASLGCGAASSQGKGPLLSWAGMGPPAPSQQIMVLMAVARKRPGSSFPGRKAEREGFAGSDEG